MANYKAFKKRQENASPFASNANCRKCEYGNWIRTSAFCSGFGKARKIRYADWDTEKNGYCTQFKPRKMEDRCLICGQIEYEMSVEMQEHNEMYEPAYNPEDGSM